MIYYILTHISGQALSLPSQPVHVNTYTLLSEVSSLHPTFFFIMGLLGSLKNGRLQGPMQVGRGKATAIIALTEAKKPGSQSSGREGPLGRFSPNVKDIKALI